MDLVCEALGVDERKARSRLVFVAVGECFLVSCELVEFFEGVVVDVRSELLGLSGGDVVDLGARDLSFVVLLGGAEEGFEECNLSVRRRGVGDELGGASIDGCKDASVGAWEDRELKRVVVLDDGLGFGVVRELWLEGAGEEK